MILDLQRKFVSLLFVSWGVGNCWGGWSFDICRFVGKLRWPTSKAGVKDLERGSDHAFKVDHEAEIALAKASGYNRRPLVMLDWETNEEIIRAMVNEAEYNVEEANKLSRTDMDSQYLQALERFNFYNRNVLILAQQKAFRLRSSLASAQAKGPYENSDPMKSVEDSKGETRVDMSRSQHMPPVPGPPILKALNPTGGKDKNQKLLSFAGSRTRWPQEPVLESQASKQWLSEGGSDHQILEVAQLGLDLEPASFQISIELKGCLLLIFSREEPLKDALVKQHEDFIKAVFRAVEFLHKYNFINPDQMAKFFTSDTHMLSLTGQHIGGSFTFFFYSDALVHQLDMTRMVFSPETDHIRHCLKDLESKSQKMIIHLTFSCMLKRSKIFIDWTNIPSELKTISHHLTGEVFWAELLERMQDGEAMIEQSSLKGHVASLIKFFEQPQRFRRSVTYMLIVNLLYHISQNLCNENELKWLCDESEISYELLRSKLQIFVIVNRISSLRERWLFYADRERYNTIKVFPEIQTNSEKSDLEQTIKQLTVEYNKILQEMESNENSRRWKHFPITEDITREQSEFLQSTLEDMSEKENQSKAT